MSTLLDNLLGFPQIGGVQRKYLWNLLLPDLFGIHVGGWWVAKYCRNFKVGQYNISDVQQLRVGQQLKFFPKMWDIQSVKATFITPTPDLVSLYLAKWKSLIMDEDGLYNVASVYKKNMHVILWDRSGLPSNVLRIQGAFPITFPAFDLEHENEELVKFDIEFKVERVSWGFDAINAVSNNIFGS